MSVDAYSHILVCRSIDVMNASNIFDYVLTGSNEIDQNRNYLYLLHKDVVVTKSGKVYLTGIRYYSKSLDNSINEIVNRAFDYDPDKNIFNNSKQVMDMSHVLLLKLIDNGCIKFK